MVVVVGEKIQFKKVGKTGENMRQKPKNRRLKVIVTEKSSEKWKKGQKAEHFKQREMKKTTFFLPRMIH